MVNQSQIMKRAWSIFRETYHYPEVPFRCIGRKCFAWALREAWREHREAQSRAAIPAEVRTARVTELRAHLEMLPFIDNYREVAHRAATINRELAQLRA